jgi:hypothetical protein
MVSPREDQADLPACPNPATCAEADGLDLGEISLQTDGSHQLELDTPVTTIAFRKPNSRAVLAATMALASQAGPLLSGYSMN